MEVIQRMKPHKAQSPAILHRIKQNKILNAILTVKLYTLQGEIEPLLGKLF